jgi:thioredoxin-related protein
MLNDKNIKKWEKKSLMVLTIRTCNPCERKKNTHEYIPYFLVFSTGKDIFQL